jgi:monoterpene epsilon-lactone hydrolase
VNDRDGDDDDGGGALHREGTVTDMSSPLMNPNPNDFIIPDLAAKRLELELQEDLPDGSMRFPNFTLPIFPGTTFSKVTCNGVPCEWIRTPGSEDSPVVYFHMHGGGYYRGNTRVEAPGTSVAAGLAKIRCLTVDYRVSPPSTDGYRAAAFPAAVEDCFAAYTWLIDPEGGGVDPKLVVAGGCSAGGGLAVALLLKIKEQGVPMPAASVPLSPWVDLTQSGESYYYNHGKCRYVTKGYLDWASRQYLDGQDPRHPLASPLFADLSGLPPLLIIAGGDETLLDDATLLAARAATAGCEVSLEIYPGVSHGFMLGCVPPIAAAAAAQ